MTSDTPARRYVFIGMNWPDDPYETLCREFEEHGQEAWLPALLERVRDDPLDCVLAAYGKQNEVSVKTFRRILKNRTSARKHTMLNKSC